MDDECDASSSGTFGPLWQPAFAAPQSYPPANLWSEQDDSLAQTALACIGPSPLSLYVHVPFCRKLCLYCGCNMMVTRSQDLVARYLRALDAEVDRVAKLLPSRPEVVQVHLGGGTPTYLDPDQLSTLWQTLTSRFPMARGIEASIEIHRPSPVLSSFPVWPSWVLTACRWVRDFDKVVQKRINRPQPFEQTRELVELSRKLGFVSVNLDLMYGLPLQSVDRFAHLDRSRGGAIARPAGAVWLCPHAAASQNASGVSA